MKKGVTLVLLLALWPFATCYAQLQKDGEWLNYNLNKEWQTYQYRSKDDLYLLREKYFRDTITIDEMKAAFRANKDKPFNFSPYSGHDSIFSFRGNLLNLVRPKAKGLPLKRFYMNPNKTKEEAKLLDGDLVFLRYPQHYMGYVVSPQPLLETFDKGRIMGREGVIMWGGSQFLQPGATGDRISRRHMGGPSQGRNPHDGNLDGQG
ncbi:MAG: hypothetical protein KIG92_03575 [Prevotella sp.]|nr:hypothetical protein [Prevotella sp.]